MKKNLIFRYEKQGKREKSCNFAAEKEKTRAFYNQQELIIANESFLPNKRI